MGFPDRCGNVIIMIIKNKFAIVQNMFRSCLSVTFELKQLAFMQFSVGSRTVTCLCPYTLILIENNIVTNGWHYLDRESG